MTTLRVRLGRDHGRREQQNESGEIVDLAAAPLLCDAVCRVPASPDLPARSAHGTGGRRGAAGRTSPLPASIRNGTPAQRSFWICQRRVDPGAF
jgi:hypothetical protein